jgi:hypothetical protein
MEALMTQPARTYLHIGGTVLTVALTALIGGLSAVPARADNDDRDRGRYEHQERARDRHHERRAYDQAPPPYVYAPPPVYYAPPPPPPAIDFVIPLDFR